MLEAPFSVKNLPMIVRFCMHYIRCMSKASLRVENCFCKVCT